MQLYRVHQPNDQEVFPCSIGNESKFQQIGNLVAELEESSFWKLICKIKLEIFKAVRLHKASLESAATIIEKSLDEEMQFARTENLSFKCFFARTPSALEIFPSFRPLDVDEASGWLQRRLLVMRSHSQIWILLPKP